MGAFSRAVTRNPLLVWTSREIVGWTPFLFILILLFQLDLNSFMLGLTEDYHHQNLQVVFSYEDYLMEYLVLC